MSDQVRRVPASLPRVVDGDTVEVTISLGWHIYLREIVRLYGVNCPETHGPKRSNAGFTAALFTAEWLKEAKSLEIESLSFESRTDKYGRTLARIYRNDDPVSLNQALLDSGNAIIFMV